MLITALAKTKIEEFLSDTPDKVFLIAVTSGGCSGFSYLTEIVDPNAENYIEIYDRVVTNSQSEAFLKHTIVDYTDSIFQSGFTFSNPDASSTCGCGISFDL